MPSIKWQQLIFLLFLLPRLVYGLNEKECLNFKNHALAEWNRHRELLLEAQKFGAEAKSSRLHCLKESLSCCQKALSFLNTILNNIANKSKKKRKKPWRLQMKKACKQDKKNLHKEIATLQKAIDNTLSIMAFEKAKTLYDESLKKADLASKQKQTSPPLTLTNIKKVIATLHEITKLYRQAHALAKEAADTLIAAPSSNETNKTILLQTAETYHQAILAIEKEIAECPQKALAQKNTLKKHLETLTKDFLLFQKKGLKRSAYESQKQALPILEMLIKNSHGKEKEALQQKRKKLKTSMEIFEKEADQNRLTNIALPLSHQEFKAKEKEKREVFFKETSYSKAEIFFKTLIQNQTRPFVIPLDGVAGKKDQDYLLYLDQFCRFLVQSDFPVSSLCIQVSKGDELIHEETISLPMQNTFSWHRYLTVDGMLFIPETKLKNEYGIELRLAFISDPTSPFSMIINPKGGHPKFKLSFSLNGKDTLFSCRFSLPPPWQLNTLLKPFSPNPYKPHKPTPIDLFSVSSHLTKIKDIPPQPFSYPLLDKLVEQLQKDPLLLTQYVYQEIALTDPYLKQENHVFQPPGIFRNPLMTYLERRGSPWEQCSLLVYLLRKAGHQAHYVMGDPCILPKDFTERMLATKLLENQKEALVHYPWVLLIHKEKPIFLFPWMKEIQITEGYDLYNLMPEEYANAERWVKSYLKGDETILKHIGPDDNDTAALLFSRFVNEQLRKQGLSLADVGIRRKQIKRQYSSWEDFPRPKIQGSPQILTSIETLPNLAAFILIDISSRENPHKCLSCSFPAARLNCQALPIQFIPHGKNGHRLKAEFIDKQVFLDLDQTDQIIDIKVSYTIPVGSDGFHGIQTLSLAKGTKAALCFHLGGATPHKTTEFYKQFCHEKNPQKRVHALLALAGATYFEKCGFGEELFANLHKVTSKTSFAFGLVKLSPDLSKKPFKTQIDLCLPQVDMFWFNNPTFPLLLQKFGT